MLKRNYLLFTVLLLGGLVLWIIALRKSPPSPYVSSQAVVQPTPASAGAYSLTPPPTPQTTPRAKPRLSFEALQSLTILAFRTPITFYGRAVDQHGAPVVGANVKFFANDSPFGGKSSEYNQQTDADGRFSLEGSHGITLAVSVSKPGYRVLPQSDEGQPASSGLFEYHVSDKSIRGAHRPNKEAPTTFVLYKVGPVEPLVKIEEHNSRMTRDGSPLSIFLDQQGGHQVVLRCWNKEREPRPAEERKYDWRLEVTAPGGDLVVRENAFAFEAPEGGYLPNDTIIMSATMPFGYGGWSSSAECSYFFHFADNTFARANLRMHAGGDHFVVWESFFNPKPGSRNLESDPGKEAGAP